MTDPSAYRPGSWYGVFGAEATVLLPPSERARVPELWQALDQGAGFDEVLDLLLAGGLRALPVFVLLGSHGAATRVLVRGAVTARFTAADEEFELAGASAGIWVERTLFGVTASRIELEEPADDLVLSITEGLVRLSGLLTPVPTSAPVPTTTPVPTSAPVPLVVDDDVADLAPPEPTGAPDQPPVAALVLSSGETVVVDRVLLIGRAPEAARASAAEQPRLVAVPSPHHEISSTHLEVRPGSGADHGSAVVTDLGSTNGTVLVQPGLPPEDLKPGIAVQLVPGAIIDLGEGVTIQVVAG